MTTIARVKALEIQTALTDARTYEHADQLKQLGEQFDKLAEDQLKHYSTLLGRIESLCAGTNVAMERRLNEISALETRLAALEHLSGIRCNVPAEPTHGWQKIVTLGTIIIPKPSLWQKFKRFLGF